MLRIEINGSFLDLAPGTAVQVERQSPFFGLDNLASEYSLPLTLLYTPGNAQALGLPNHFYTRRIKQRIAGVKLYDDLNFSYTGELVVQAAALNVNDVTKSTITAYFVTGASSFFQAIKNKKLKQLELGGVRSFAWTNDQPTAGGNGWWQHVHQTLSGGMPYSFMPIRNEKWAGNSEEGTPDFMNKLNEAGFLDANNNFNTLAPQVQLKYLLNCIFEEHGWYLDASAMDGTYWETLYMPSFYAVTWQKVIEIAQPPYFVYSPLPTVQLDLRNHVPPEEEIANAIINLRNRYNWGFDFDANAKVCKLFPLKDVVCGRRKDWTPYMAAGWEFDFSEDTKVFAFTCDQDGSDSLSSQPDFAKVKLLDPVFSFLLLPMASAGNYNQVVYCWLENQYWQCRYDEEERTYYWGHFANGVYNLEPTGANETIPTGIGTLPMYRTQYRNNGNDYFAQFPTCEQEGNWEGKEGDFIPWSMRLLFHRGWVREANSTGVKGQRKYPCLSSLANTITQEEPDLPWSNVYQHEWNNVDLGIVAYWWRGSLEYMSSSEVGTGTLYLPRPELLEYRWDDVILLRNIPFLVEQMTDALPYRGAVQVKMKRVG